MNFVIYRIESAVLKPWVQYILFNHSSESQYHGEIRSFANTNYCLGIVNNQQLHKDESGVIRLRRKTGIHSYLTGIYLHPYKFHASGQQDEICIDFTPAGFYHFFRFHAKTFLLQEDILSEAFGKNATHYFEKVFAENDFFNRGQMIETFLLNHFIKFPEINFLKEALYHIDQNCSGILISTLAAKMKCSERSIHRFFINYLDISPKEYIRVARFRKSIALQKKARPGLTKIAYDCGYYDQSHMIREFRYFSGSSPNDFFSSLKDISGEVFVLTKH